MRAKKCKMFNKMMLLLIVLFAAFAYSHYRDLDGFHFGVVTKKQHDIFDGCDFWKIFVTFPDYSVAWVPVTRELYDLIDIGEQITMTQGGELSVG